MTRVIGDACPAARHGYRSSDEIRLPASSTSTCGARVPGWPPRRVGQASRARTRTRDLQIAERLFISPKTASVHVSRILHKLGAANRVEAAATAYRLRLGD
jgi:hypothetical protein